LRGGLPLGTAAALAEVGQREIVVREERGFQAGVG